MTDRITLALAACQGMTDEDLAKRGTGAFAKMIDRKRKYAFAARTLAAAVPTLEKKVAELQHQLALAQAQLASLQELDEPVTDTTEAAALLANLSKKDAS